ncbi:hypothetical protein HaLaN_25265 [Haematococcus lacustris]|uniref:Uncharacterized protein n=1 Tax=Haematococcus lacustris TaxID=44745 RepID=A0A6A0A3U0_HAELA|nr:hypothetical protein HaLaN_25265 [Haematococcus lacustris]
MQVLATKCTGCDSSPCRRKRARTHLSCSLSIALVDSSGINERTALGIEPHSASLSLVQAASEDRRGASY